MSISSDAKWKTKESLTATENQKLLKLYLLPRISIFLHQSHGDQVNTPKQIFMHVSLNIFLKAQWTSFRKIDKSSDYFIAIITFRPIFSSSLINVYTISYLFWAHRWTFTSSLDCHLNCYTVEQDDIKLCVKIFLSIVCRYRSWMGGCLASPIVLPRRIFYAKFPNGQQSSLHQSWSIDNSSFYINVSKIFKKFFLHAFRNNFAPLQNIITIGVKIARERERRN